VKRCHHGDDIKKDYFIEYVLGNSHLGGLSFQKIRNSRFLYLILYVGKMFSILVTKFSIGDSPATSSKSRVLQHRFYFFFFYFFNSTEDILFELKPAVNILKRTKIY